MAKSIESAEALKKYESELIECLESINLVSLARQATERNLIPNDVETNLESLHPKVPRPMMCRYLLFNVYNYIIDESGEVNIKAYKSWMKVLSKLKVPSHVLSQLRHWYESSQGTISSSESEESMVLNESHISDLTEVLVGCSSKWKEIAISLGLPSNEIENILAKIHMYSPVMCLQQVLLVWVKCKFSNAKPPTLENLETTLRSRTVGLGAEADKPSNFFRPKSSIKELSYNPAIKVDEKFTIISQTLNFNVAEGSSVLFELQVSTISDHPVSYKWYKDEDEKVSPNAQVVSNYGGFSTIIIYLCVEDVTVEGTYVCHIQHIWKTLVSKPIVLCVSTSLDQYKNVLTDFYTGQPEVPKDTWPPVSSNTYISLALIKQESIQHAGEYGHCTIRGDIDDIYKDKESIIYEKAFSNLKFGTRLLVEGRPGSGKTTLVHKISQDWARGKLALHHVKLLFLVPLRAFSSDPNIELHDILKCYYSVSATIKNISEYAEKHSGLGLCFVLDGLDEYTPNKSNAYIFRLINKQVLPKSIVIIASRPAAAAEFRYVATKQVEVIGFLKNQIHDYIEKYPFSEESTCQESKCHELHLYLYQHPNVHHMCYLPIHAAMVCFLFGYLAADLPQTETEIYLEFTKYTILRFLYRDESGHQVCVESFNDLTMPQRDLYSKICKLAYEMTVSSRQVMKQMEAKSFFHTQDEKDFLGLITVDMMAMRCGFQHLYSFLHLTFQEFLGACYISELKEEEQIELIVNYNKAKQMQQVWKFYCGLVKFSEDCKRFKALISRTEYGTLFKVQCCFESQQSHVCDSAFESNALSFTDTFLSPSNFTEIAYVICNTHKKCVEMISFEGCVFDEEGVYICTKKAGVNLSLLTTLCYHNCSIEQLQMVNYFMHCLPSLEMLDISHTNLDGEKIKALTKKLSHPNLRILKIGSRGNILYSSIDLQKDLIDAFFSNCIKFVNICFCGTGKPSVCLIQNMQQLSFYFHCDFPVLNLSFCKLTMFETMALSSDLKCNPFYTRLSLVNCGINDTAASCLSLGLKHCHNLDTLQLSFNNISDIGVVSISENVKFCTKLHILDLSCNSISDRGAIVLANALKANTKLKLLLTFNNITGFDNVFHSHSDVNFHKVDISDQDFADAGVAWLAEAIQTSDKCNGLLQLHLYRSSITTLGIRSLNSTLVQSRNLLVLNLSFNTLKNDGVIVLSKVLEHCTKLHKLDVSSNYFGSDGAEALANALIKLSNLLELKINCNYIGSKGAKALAKALKSCVILQELEISSNYIGCKGAKYIADAMKHWTNFYSLDISCNNLFRDGAKAIADSLMHCTYLHKLAIGHNDLQSDGVEYLAIALKKCTYFETLDVSYNNIGSSSARALANLLKSITALNVSHNNIGFDGAQVLADTLRQCTNISEFNISSNNLDKKSFSYLSNALLCCKRIKKLEIGCKGIRSSGAKIFADVIGNASHIICKLDISGNIGVLNHSNAAVASTLKHCKQIHELNISNTGVLESIADVKVLASSLRQLTSLRVLNISFNNVIISDGVKIIFDGLTNCPNLCELRINDSNIGDDGACALASTLKHFKNLHVLDVANNNIRSRGAIDLADSLNSITSLGEFNVSNNQLGSIGGKALSQCIKYCTGISSLNINCINLGSEVIKQIATSLHYCTTHLKNLYVNNNLLLVDGTRALSMVLQYCNQLQVLHVSDNNIEGDGIKALVDALKKCTQLQVLNISKNNIQLKGALALRDALHYWTQLQVLNISSNKIEEEGMTNIAMSLQYCTQLQVLNISNNDIKNGGALYLARALGHFTQLQVLNISDNDIGGSGLDALSKGLKYCEYLVELYSSNNKPGFSGVESLSRNMLSHCTCLHVLDVSYNYLVDSDALVLAEGLEHCANLHKLDIRANKIGAIGAKALAKALQHCPSLTKLSIVDNPIGKEGVEALKNSLKNSL